MAEHIGSETWKQAPENKIDLNAASKEDLMQLRGISERRAEQIIGYREEHGGFSSVDELKNIEGFSEVLTEDFRDALTVAQRPGGGER